MLFEEGVLKRSQKVPNLFPLLYTVTMTRMEIINHWRKGSQDALRAAHVLYNDNNFSLALFDCHLAVEKALKALAMKQHNKEPPFSHDLVFLAEQVRHKLTKRDNEFLLTLSDFAVDARYDDPTWAEKWATKDRVADALKNTDRILRSLLPA